VRACALGFDFLPECGDGVQGPCVELVLQVFGEDVCFHEADGVGDCLE
jgi:hypothetical protein